MGQENVSNSQPQPTSKRCAPLVLTMMNRIILYVLSFLVIEGCTIKNHNITETAKSKRILDSLKMKFAIKDSIKLLYNDTSSFTIFIDYNKNSEYHKEQKRRYDHWYFDSTYYYDQILEQKKKIQTENKPYIPDSLRNRLIPIYSIDSEFYVYYDCDFQPIFEINDSTFNWYDMEPVKPYLFDSLIYTNNGFEFKNVLNQRIYFEVISNTSKIYKLNIDERCYYVTPIENINKFPILVVFCSKEGLSPIIDEVKFDEIKCK